MKKELDDALCRDFPNTFRDRHGDIRTTCMAWGFDCGDGWEPIIREAASKIEPILEGHIRLGDSSYLDMTSAQVKEKFGGLRWYWTSATDQIYDIVREAESKSFETCEECGKPGQTRPGGWIQTLCDDCVVNRKRA